jgi:hypothetical protein
MLTSRNLAGRTQPIRLCDVPLTIRRRHGRHLIDLASADGDLLLAVQLRAAVEQPSERVYWLPETAVRKVMGT